MTLAHHEPQGQHIRKTNDGRFSVFDALQAVGASNPRATWERITTTYREVVAKTDNFKFAGRGQRETPVTSLEGWRSILTVLPGILGDQYRADANQLVTAFLERPLELATAIQQAIPVQPKSQTRLLLESVQAMVQLEERTDGLESRATEIESRQEKLEQRLVRSFCRIKCDLQRFGVRAVVLIGGVLYVPACVSHFRRGDAGQVAKQFLQSPKASSSQNCILGHVGLL